MKKGRNEERGLIIKIKGNKTEGRDVSNPLTINSEQEVRFRITANK